MIQTRESALCKLRKTHMTEAEGGSSVGQYCSDTYSFTSLNLDILRFLHQLEIVIVSLRARGGATKKGFGRFHPKVLPTVRCIFPVAISPTF